MKRTNTQKLTACAMLGAVSAILLFFNISVPFMPSFIKLDFSELPALLAAYSYGPMAGVAVCRIKNLLNLFTTQTGGVGELSNFLLGCSFVVPAGIVYSKLKTKSGAVIGAFIGAVAMAAFSLITNYYIIYPTYTLIMPMEAIIGAYKAINPAVNSLWQALVMFNMPFTFMKGMLNLSIAMFVYKPLSPLLKGRK